VSIEFGVGVCPGGWGEISETESERADRDKEREQGMRE
jgi:hypothetical protein